MTDEYGSHTITMNRIFKCTLTIFTATALFAAAAVRAADAPPTVEFSSVVAKGGGLWPQVQVLADGTLLAFGYNAAAHTTLPGDVDVWASSDGGKTWSFRATAAARPDANANMCHWASGLSAKGELIVLASGMDDAANERGQRAQNEAPQLPDGKLVTSSTPSNPRSTTASTWVPWLDCSPNDATKASRSIFCGPATSADQNLANNGVFLGLTRYEAPPVTPRGFSAELSCTRGRARDSSKKLG